MRIRHANVKDAWEIVSCQYGVNPARDGEDRPVLPFYAWDERTVIKENRRKAGPDFRFLVAEEDWVCGAMFYEFIEGGYRVRLFCAHPDAPPGTRDALWESLLGWWQKAYKRKVVEVIVGDGDDEQVAFWLNKGFKLERHSVDAYGVIDYWRLSLGREAMELVCA